MDRETTLNRWLDSLEEKLKENTVERKEQKRLQSWIKKKGK